jgi:inner membrane protein
MIKSLITERKVRRDSVADEISGSWGDKQFLVGPVLSIPFRQTSYDDQNNTYEYIQYAHFLPETLDIRGTIDPEIRNRGIYDVIVYKSDLNIISKFNYPNFDGLNVNEDKII